VIPVNESQVSSTTRPVGDAAPTGTITRPRPPGGPRGPAPAPPRPAARPSGWTAGRITAVVIGALLGLVSLGLLGGAGTAFWADWTQRDGSYVTTGVHEFSTAGSALATEPTDLGRAGVGWLYSPGLLGEVRIRVTPASQGARLFVGIGPAAAVDRYLAGVDHSVITEFWGGTVDTVRGGAPASPPGSQDFWVASDTGTGTRSVVWTPTGGSWSVVIMNADARPGVAVSGDLGARIPSLLWIAIGLLIVGAVFATAAAFLIVGAVRRIRATRAATA
jgi:hypothetical protein